MATNSFAPQSFRGNQVVYANPKKIDNTLTVNSSSSKDPDKRLNGMSRVRCNFTVGDKIGVTADCSDCKHSVPVSARIDLSSVSTMTEENIQAYLKYVFDPVVAAARQSIVAGALVGFKPPVDFITGS